MSISIDGQKIGTFNQGSSIVKLNITHSNLKIQAFEVRFDQYDTIAGVKSTCEKKMGTPAEQMQLILQDSYGSTVAYMSEDDRTLGYYCPQEGYIIHVLDLNPNSITKDLEDLSQIEKYKMKDEDYDKLQDSFRKYKDKLMKAHPEYFKKKEKVEKGEDFMMEEAMGFLIGARCQLTELKHRGEIKYIGQVPELGEGWFIGIKLDEPFGKNDGKAGDSTYFNVPKNYGLFVRPNKVEQGDFPELDLDDEI